MATGQSESAQCAFPAAPAVPAQPETFADVLASSPLAPGLSADLCSYGRESVIGVLALYVAPDLCGPKI